MEEESIKLKQLQEVTLTSKFKLSLTSLDRITLRFYNKQVKEKRIQILSMDRSGYFQEDYQFQELLETLRQKEKNLEVTQT